jgi:hypothetical protein
MYVYRCLKNQTADATWNTYDGSNAWDTAGAAAITDRDGSDTSQNYALTTAQANGYFDITMNITEVQKMFDGTYSNYGFTLYMQTETDDCYGFETSGNYPRWVITYPETGGFLPFI